MTFEQAEGIYQHVRKSKLNAPREQFIADAVRYARMRVDYLLADAEKQRWMGHDRSTAHNNFIESCDALAEAMMDQGEDPSWRRSLGHDRKVIGDFACYVHCILGLFSR